MNEKEKLINILKQVSISGKTYTEYIEAIAERFTAADVVEVVRCKDCQYCEECHYEEEGEKPYIKLKCKWSNYSHAPSDYCSYGERREG